ncbi:MAG TPA: TetR/AcrR family transcriptional regulator [Candidatus Limnocylindrales bacterium]
MPRTLDPEAHAVRRDAFIDVAQRLIQVKGYEQMSIQDVLDELDASRGAFYHYFDAKEELLAAVVERIAATATATLEPIVVDPDLTAIQKFEGIFAGLARWKGERRELMLAILQVWLSDDNAIVRERLRKDTVVLIAPLLATILRQGNAEGTFSVSSPDEAARVLISLIQGSGDIASELFFARQAGTVEFDVVERAFAAYSEALERILGVSAGSLNLADPATLHDWYD